MLNARENPYCAVYQILEEVSLDPAGTIGAGSCGAIFTAIDVLRQRKADRADIETVERISIAMHRLRLAISSSDRSALAAGRAELRALAEEWLSRPITLH